MKFNKTNLVAVLSLTLLLSTQTKPMGHDAELALQAPMAELPVTIVNPSLREQATNTFSKAINYTIDSSKSLYGVTLDNKALVAGVAGMGVGVLAYKKYPKSAIATGLAGSAVTAVALTAKYSPKTVETVNNAAGVAGNSVATFAKNAGNYVVEAGKSAGSYIAANAVEAANFVAANTPEVVTNAASYIENNELQVPVILGAGLVGYGAYKAFAPAKKAVKNAGELAINAGKAVANRASKVTARQVLSVAAPVAVVGGLGVAAYKNQEVISTMAKNVVESVSNSTAGQFVAKQAGKLAVNGARLVEAARNLDVKAMAKNTGNFILNNKKEIIGAGTLAVGTGYVVDKYVMPQPQTLEERRGAKKLAARIAKAGDVVAITYPESVIAIDAITKSKVVLAPVAKPAPAKAKEELPVKLVAPETDPSKTILPGQVAA